jgi:hypothetical protein
MDTDFGGYISKFYSQIIYQFDNKSLLTKQVDQFIEGLTVVQNREEFNIHSAFSGREIEIFKYIIKSFISNKELLIKDIVEKRNLKINIPNKIVYDQSQIKYTLWQFDSLRMLEVLKYILGNLDQVITATETCKFYEKMGQLEDRGDQLNHFKVSYFIPVWDLQNNGRFDNEKKILTISNVDVHYQIRERMGYIDKYDAEITNCRKHQTIGTIGLEGEGKKLTKIPFFEFFGEYLSSCKILNIH